MTANALGLLGLARKARKLELGEDPVGAACRGHRARLVLLAGDAAENTLRRVRRWSESAGVPCIQLDATKEELGSAMGRSSCAVLALTDAGFAKALQEKLEEKPM